MFVQERGIGVGAQYYDYARRHEHWALAQGEGSQTRLAAIVIVLRVRMIAGVQALTKGISK
jgi:hypothetical protein